MKRLTRIIWIALIIAIIVVPVVLNMDEVLNSVKKLPSSIGKLPLIGKIFIGFFLWIISVIVPFIIYSRVVKPPEEGPGIFWLFFFTMIWPPAWPIAPMVFIILKVGSR